MKTTNIINALILIIYMQSAGADAAYAAEGAKSVESAENNFSDASALQKWNSNGATIDNSENHSATGNASLYLPPGSHASITLSEGIQAGTITFWLKENNHINANAKAAHVGPKWGFNDNKSNFFGMGTLYIKYLAGDSTYTVINKERSGSDFGNVQYTGSKRSAVWQKWELSISDKQVVAIKIDGKVNARLDAGKIKCDGISSFTILETAKMVLIKFG
ncbi:MAG: hypothetical protein HRU15_04865 [Planctomycetes bacterium]|nr:hypothetical protein [Planctomycetota bacterium]